MNTLRPNFYSQAPRDADLSTKVLPLTSEQQLFQDLFLAQLGPNSDSVPSRYLYRCLTIKTKFLKDYTAPTHENKLKYQLLSFHSFFRQQHFSYPYWTDFLPQPLTLLIVSTHWVFVNNVAGGPAVFPLFVFIVEAHTLWYGSVSHLLILLGVVLVFLSRI